MKRYAVQWSTAARNDLREIHAYLLGVTSRRAADRLTGDIRKSVRFLPDHPRLYRIFEGSVKGARHFIVHRWRVLYVIDDAACLCTVVAVVDASRNI